MRSFKAGLILWYTYARTYDQPDESQQEVDLKVRDQVGSHCLRAAAELIENKPHYLVPSSQRHKVEYKKRETACGNWEDYGYKITNQIYDQQSY